MTNMEYLQIKMFLQQDITRTQNTFLKQEILIGAITLIMLCIRIFKTSGAGDEILEIIIGIGCLYMIITFTFSLRKEPYQKRREVMLDEMQIAGIDAETAIKKLNRITSFSIITELLKEKETLGMP